MNPVKDNTERGSTNNSLIGLREAQQSRSVAMRKVVRLVIAFVAAAVMIG